MTLRAIIVGEAWGASEATYRHPFVGASGRELARMVAAAGLGPKLANDYANESQMIAHWARARADFGLGLANVFSEQPPGNNVFHFFDRDGDHNLPAYAAASRRGYVKPEFLHHLHHLWSTIEDEKPNVIIATGNASCWATIGQTKITVLRGTVQQSKRLQRKVLPTFHAAAVLRNWPLRTITIADLAKANVEAEFPEIRRPPRWLTIPDPTPEGIGEIAEWLSAPASSYAIDIETYGKQITIVGFARSADQALVVPIIDHQLRSYWPTSNLETDAWRWIRRGLKRQVPKTFQNGLYDISYFIRMGLVPTMCHDDTMLKHHSRYPELQKSLGFLASLYCNEVAWKSMRRVESLKRDE